MTTIKTATAIKMTYKTIIGEAIAKGFKQTIRNKVPVMVTCDVCHKEATIVFGDTKFPIWANTRKAIIFTSGKITVHACPCGHRKQFINEGSVATNTTAKIPKKITKKVYCKTIGCAAILPRERKAFCYRCRPRKSVDQTSTEKECKSSINM